MTKLKESSFSVLPIALLILVISFTPLVSFTTTEIVAFSISALCLIVGMTLFNLGADLSMTPMGEYIGRGLTKNKTIRFLPYVAFVMGVLITIAEPDLSVLATQVSAVMNGTLLIVTVGVGVGLFLLIAVLKILLKKDLTGILIFFYMILFAFSALLLESGKAEYLPMSFDSGGVTTGPITVPFIMALGVGISTTIGGKQASENSFGLIALCSVGPILAVLILSLTAKGEMAYTLMDYSVESHLGAELGYTILSTLEEVAKALGLIVLFFVGLEIFILKIPPKKLLPIAVGVVFTFLGLVIFLTSATIGFMPIGFKLGTMLAGYSNIALIVFALILGALTVLAEPAVHVLNKQVEKITNGTVSKLSMLIALSVGVGLSILLSVIRIIYNFSVLYYLIPGYLLSLGLSFFVPKIYTAIAFDSGGVASGPLTSGFILPFAIGVCTAIQGENSILSLGFGIVAMVALTPLITIQLLGFRAVIKKTVRSNIAMKRIISSDDEQIIDFM